MEGALILDSGDAFQLSYVTQEESKIYKPGEAFMILLRWLTSIPYNETFFCFTHSCQVEGRRSIYDRKMKKWLLVYGTAPLIICYNM